MHRKHINGELLYKARVCNLLEIVQKSLGLKGSIQCLIGNPFSFH